MNYLKISASAILQLQPIYDYATVDEARPDGGYNWGYDPLNYNVPEGSFATDAFHGEVRAGVPRHGGRAAPRRAGRRDGCCLQPHLPRRESNFERTVPGYWNRRWPNGMTTNGSGCGCDLASERPMVRKYIVESVLYWATTYHIDGFRFDLMALEDVDTMNAIRAALDSLPGGENILMYGEPWMGGGTNIEGGARPADKRALDALNDRIGFFCDDTRDCIKGNVFDAANAGYVNGAPQHGLRCAAPDQRMAQRCPVLAAQGGTGGAVHLGPRQQHAFGTSWPPWPDAATTTGPTPTCWRKTAWRRAST